MYDYLPEFVKKFNGNKHEKVKIVIDVNPIVEIEFVIRSNNSKHNLRNTELCKKYLKELMNEIYKNTKLRRKKIIIEYYPTKNSKKLPKSKNTILKVESINSGLSYPYSRDGNVNIIIYRQEEFFKVLTHEMLHIYHVVPEDYNLELKIKRMYPNLFRTITLNEALVELNAMLINISIIGRLTNNDMEKMLKDEFLWSKKQCEKLKEHFNIKANTVKSINDNFKEEGTHAFSYYLLKYSFFETLFLQENKKQVSKLNLNKNSLRMTINDIENIKVLKDISTG